MYAILLSPSRLGRRQNSTPLESLKHDLGREGVDNMLKLCYKDSGVLVFILSAKISATHGRIITPTNAYRS